MPQPTLHSETEYAGILERISNLQPESPAIWGTMNVGLMLAHCAEAQEVFNGKVLENTPWIAKLMGGFIRKSVFNDKPFGRNIRTHPQYIMKSDFDFAEQTQRLLAALECLKNDGTHQDNAKHPLFGDISRQEKGAASLKHLDHHLRQFGV